MPKVSTKPPSGTRDFLPLDIARRRYVVSEIEATFEAYGFVPLETPAFENLTTLLGKYGTEGDQLIYRLLHRRDALTRALENRNVDERQLADLGLRYDLTVPLARVVAEHKELPKYFKRYQIQPVWRADRPGRGRFREFVQCDIDMLGTQALVAEAELCSAVAEALNRLGFNDFAIEINHRALLREFITHAGIDPALESSALIALDKLEKIGIDGVKNELNERGIGASEAERLLALTRVPQTSTDAWADGLRAHLDSDSAELAISEISNLIRVLENIPAGKHLRVNPCLARGLSYYSGLIFEIRAPGIPGSLGGGGRYDNLIGMFRKTSVPAVGFSLGFERILLLMADRGLYPPLAPGPHVMLCSVGIDITRLLPLATRLRQAGLRVDIFPEPAKLGKQLHYADSPSVKIPVVAIVGEDELARETLTLKHLGSGTQEKVPVASAAPTIRAWITQYNG